MGKKETNSGEVDELDIVDMLSRIKDPGALELVSEDIGEDTQKRGERIAHLLNKFPRTGNKERNK